MTNSEVLQVCMHAAQVAACSPTRDLTPEQAAVQVAQAYLAAEKVLAGATSASQEPATQARAAAAVR